MTISNAFDGLMEQVVSRLPLGEPNRHLSKPGELRYGTHGSLWINITKGVWRDHEAGVGGGVIALVMRQLGCSKPEALAWLEQTNLLQRRDPQARAGNGRTRQVSDTPIATYPYEDEGGDLRFQVLRYPGHQFSQRRPNGNGGWINNIKGVRRVLYRLPELHEAMALERIVFVVEGEKDVDSLRALGVPATCNPGGAGKWRPDYSEMLRGADVVIIGDNDDPGRAHIQHVAAALHGVARRIRVLDLAQVWPDCPHKGDVSDWLQDGGTVEQLNALVEALPDWEPTVQEHTQLIQAPRWADVTKEGLPRRSYSNTRAAIQALGITCRYDCFHDRMLVGGHAIQQWSGELSDAVTYIVRQVIIDHFNFDPGKDYVLDAATTLCLENQFDPVADYLNGLKWDGVQRIDTWLATYLGAEDTPLHHAVGRLALVAAVRRVRQPGCKFDHIVVLEGREGTMKSTAIETLAGTDNFSDQTILTQSDKEQQELVRGVWLFELADLAGMRRADVEKVKAFASRTHDRARPAYGRRRVDAPRRCVFFGTTNESGYLKSQTGNRRIWPVETNIIDIAALRQDRDQLWAEAAALEEQGIALVLPEELWGDASAAQEQRRTVDPWEDALADVRGCVVVTPQGNREERISSRELLAVKLGITDKEATSLHIQRLKQVMNHLGWEGPKKLRLADKSAQRGYCRPAQDEDEEKLGSL
jgi:hypothetical protein